MGERQGSGRTLEPLDESLSGTPPPATVDGDPLPPASPFFPPAPDEEEEGACAGGAPAWGSPQGTEHTCSTIVR